MTYFPSRQGLRFRNAARAFLPLVLSIGLSNSLSNRAMADQDVRPEAQSLAQSLAQSPAQSSALASGPALKPGAVIYGVVPPLFGKRGLRDATANLERLQRLGADVLWVSPINSTDDPSVISYSVTDYFGLRSDFGTPDDFREFVKSAHARGMKVIIDFVPNHTSNAHPYFKDAQIKGPASPYYRYYERNDKGEPHNYFDWKHLPNLNFDYLPVREMIRSAFKYWIREFDVDGFRIDVAWGIRERAPDFWPKLNQELRGMKPGLVLLAEAGAHDPYYFENDFDLAYDWSDQLGVWAWKGLFEEPERIAPRLHKALTSAKSTPFQVVRFLNNNDTGKRFITRYGVKLTKVASVLQHTLPGTPIVYMGDEIGAEFEPYEDPEPLRDEDPHSLRGHYRQLASLREKLPALHGTEWAPIQPKQRNGEASIYGYFRSNGGKNAVLVLLNFGHASSAEFKIPTRYRSYFASTGSTRLVSQRSYRDELSGKAQKFRIDHRRDRIRVETESESAIVLRLE